MLRLPFPPTASPRRWPRSASRGCCRGRPTSIRRSSNGNSSTSSPGGPASATPATSTAVGAQKAVGSGANGVLLVRGDDGHGFARSPTPAGTAATNCWRATRPPRVAASCAPTTRGPIGWTAALRNAPGFCDVEGFDADRVRARRAAAGELARLAVRRSQRRGRRLQPSTSPGSEDVVAPYRPEDLTIVARHSYELATNWKVIAENYQECYHCSTIHPELSRISPPTSGENLDTRPARGWAAGCRSSTRPRRCR